MLTFHRDQQRIVVTGDMVFDNADALCHQGRDFIQHAPSVDGSVVIVDLSGVEAVSSVAVSVLLSWMRTADKHGSTLSIEAMPDRLLDIARVSGVDAVLPIENTNKSMSM